MEIETLQKKFPNIKPVTPYIYKVDKCQHGKECVYKMSLFSNNIIQISCNWCAEEFGYTNPTYIHSRLCQNYNCMCNLDTNCVFNFLYSSFKNVLSEDLIYYLVSFYQNMYNCNICNIKNLQVKKCIHCNTVVCKNCVYDYCDNCSEVVLCKKCIEYDNNYFSSLIHGTECHTCLYKICKLCEKLFKKCGWCLEYMCKNTDIHKCNRKYEIVNKREYYWLQFFTKFDTLYQEACDWYQQTKRTYDPYYLYEAIKIEALENFLEQGGYILDIPKSMRYLIKK